jgi:hypothetical protein
MPALGTEDFSSTIILFYIDLINLSNYPPTKKNRSAFITLQQLAFNGFFNCQKLPFRFSIEDVVLFGGQCYYLLRKFIFLRNNT